VCSIIAIQRPGRVSSLFCLSISNERICGKMVEAIEIAFGMVGRLGPRNRVRACTIAPSGKYG